MSCTKELIETKTLLSQFNLQYIVGLPLGITQDIKLGTRRPPLHAIHSPHNPNIYLEQIIAASYHSQIYINFL